MDKIKAALHPNRHSGSHESHHDRDRTSLDSAASRQSTREQGREEMEPPSLTPDATNRVNVFSTTPTASRTTRRSLDHGAPLPVPNQTAHTTTTETGTTRTGDETGTYLDMGSLGNALESEDHKTLQPVIQETIHHHETEEVTRLKVHERHVHHVQHHVQPLVERVDKPEVHTTHEYPVTYTTSSAMTDGGSPKAALLALLSAGPRHEEKHVCYERVRVDKGEQVREIVHYHVHNIIQPVIYRDRPVPSTCYRASSTASNPAGHGAAATAAAGPNWGPSPLEQEVLREQAQVHQETSERLARQHGPSATTPGHAGSSLSGPSERAGPATKEARVQGVVGKAF